ncbi:hypothetical protein PCE1_004385 [Barthelona sp. PCE]
MSLAPVQVYKENAESAKGSNARLEALIGATSIADLVSTTLGPAGLDKILISTSGKQTLITNDGATILSSMAVNNASAKVLIDLAKIQDVEVGDGTTSVVVLAGELLREGENLLQQSLHPQIINQGWGMAADLAVEKLALIAEDNRDNFDKFYADMLDVAKTTLSSKILNADREYFAKMCVDAVLRVESEANLDLISYVKVTGGSLLDSYLDEGFILQKRIGVGQPKRIENAKVLIANTHMDADKVKIFGARVRTDETDKVAGIEIEEKKKMARKVERIINHGCNVFINRQLIYPYPNQLFADSRIMGIGHADFDGIERLSAVLGGDIVSTFDSPENVILGEADVVSEIMIGEKRLIKFEGCKAKGACTIILRGPSDHVLDEAERSIHDALCVLVQLIKDSKIVWGGGCAESYMAEHIDQLAAKTPGKRSLAIQSFANALRRIPAILADNAGYDSAELVSNLRSAQHNGEIHAGLDMVNARITNVRELGITESFRAKCQVVISAAEAAQQIIRCDSIMKSAPPQEQQH